MSPLLLASSSYPLPSSAQAPHGTYAISLFLHCKTVTLPNQIRGYKPGSGCGGLLPQRPHAAQHGDQSPTHCISVLIQYCFPVLNRTFFKQYRCPVLILTLHRPQLWVVSFLPAESSRASQVPNPPKINTTFWFTLTPLQASASVCRSSWMFCKSWSRAGVLPTPNKHTVYPY